VQRANEAIPNERFRPNVFARPPAGSAYLANVRPAFGRRLDIPAKHASHWVLEDGLGIRLADFHPGPDQAVRILRPRANRLFLRHLTGAQGEADAEYAVPDATDVVNLSELEAQRPLVAIRGAAHESFNLLFSLPFDEQAVQAYSVEPAPSTAPRSAPAKARSSATWRRPAATGIFGFGAAVAAVGTALWISGETIRSDGTSGISQRDIADRNQRVSERRRYAYVAFGVAGAAAATGVTILLWPTKSRAELSASIRPSGITLTYRPGGGVPRGRQ
jgi:hypothetical protein